MHDDWRFLIVLAGVFVLVGLTFAVGLYLLARWTP